MVQESCPRIICLGENLGCPCGGTHVLAISEIGEIKVGESRHVVNILHPRCEICSPLTGMLFKIVKVIPDFLNMLVAVAKLCSHIS